MVERGERLGLDVEGKLLAVGVETSAVTGSVEILDKCMKSSVHLIRNQLSGTFQTQ